MRTLRLVALLVAVSACGSKPKKVKHVEHPQTGPTVDQVLADARAAAQAGDVDGAVAKYDQAYKMKADVAILEEETKVLIDGKQVDVAVTTAKAYYDAHPTDARGIHLYDQTLIAAGDFATALSVSDELLALDDGDAAAHEQKGQALVLADKVQEGVEELRTAVSIEPKNAAYLIELGSALDRAGKADEAALQLRAAVAIDPDNGRALMLLGIALRDQAELEEAETFLVQATKKSKDARPWFELGITQNKRGDDVGAEDSLAQATSIEPDNSLYQYAYGEMLRINKRYDDAVEAYRKAATLTPPHPKANAKLGMALFQAGKLGEAEVSLSDAVRKDPNNAFNYFNLGIVYKEEKKTKLAIEAFENYLKLADKDDGDRGKANDCVKALKKGKKC